MKEIKAFECDHCRKTYKRHHACIKHEDWCTKNPKNKKACSDCVHCEMTEQDYYVDTYQGKEKTKVKALYCKKIESFLIPLKAEAKGNAYDFPDHPNIPMPKECKHQTTHEQRFKQEMQAQGFFH